ncbi:hypothetical protein GCM10022252_35360 [Streptosporangium oxazolinicum]|uniref:DUF6879 domain-containing protein n=1 Tax=Streptosporangium oxazolinicum TaxID=909287 RepID=A0ABP8AY04_9ACTN
MANLVVGQGFQDLFDSFTHTAYRQESRDRYNSPDEKEAIKRFMDGDPDLEYIRSRPWLESIRAKTSEGKRFQRVRIVTVPLKDYSRYALWSVQGNLAAGEEIRYLARDQAMDLGLPQHDAWIFDSSRIALLHFDGDDCLLGAELVTDPAKVNEYEVWREIAWRNSLTRQEFIESLNRA